MACNLSAGRLEVCKESIGGIQGVYFINYTTSSFTTDANGLVTAVPSGSVLYAYQLKGSSAYTETVTTSRNNGTTFFSQALTLNLKTLTNEMTNQLKTMSYGRPQVIVTAGSIQTGGALGDLYGYSITLTGMEQLPAAFLSGSTTTNALAGLTANYTIVTGSAA